MRSLHANKLGLCTLEYPEKRVIQWDSIKLDNKRTWIRPQHLLLGRWPITRRILQNGFMSTRICDRQICTGIYGRSDLPIMPSGGRIETTLCGIVFLWNKREIPVPVQMRLSPTMEGNRIQKPTELSIILIEVKRLRIHRQQTTITTHNRRTTTKFFTSITQATT